MPVKRYKLLHFFKSLHAFLVVICQFFSVTNSLKKTKNRIKADLVLEIPGYPASDAGFYMFVFLEGVIHSGWIYSWKTLITYLVFETLLCIYHIHGWKICNTENPLIGRLVGTRKVWNRDSLPITIKILGYFFLKWICLASKVRWPVRHISIIFVKKYFFT